MQVVYLGGDPRRHRGGKGKHAVGNGENSLNVVREEVNARAPGQPSLNLPEDPLRNLVKSNSEFSRQKLWRHPKALRMENRRDGREGKAVSPLGITAAGKLRRACDPGWGRNA